PIAGDSYCYRRLTFSDKIVDASNEPHPYQRLHQPQRHLGPRAVLTGRDDRHMIKQRVPDDPLADPAPTDPLAHRDPQGPLGRGRPDLRGRVRIDNLAASRWQRPSPGLVPPADRRRWLITQSSQDLVGGDGRVGRGVSRHPAHHEHSERQHRPQLGDPTADRTYTHQGRRVEPHQPGQEGSGIRAPGRRDHAEPASHSVRNARPPSSTRRGACWARPKGTHTDRAREATLPSSNISYATVNRLGRISSTHISIRTTGGRRSPAGPTP